MAPDPDPATPPAPEGAPPPPAPPPEPDPAADLGDAGKKALDSERKARAAAEKREKDLQAQLDKLTEQNMSEQEKALKVATDAAKLEATAAVDAKYQRRLFAAEVKAASSGRIIDLDLLADPEAALRLLDLGEIPVTSSGDIDTEAISGAVERLLVAKPYLVGAKPPDLGQGARGAGGLAGDALERSIKDALGMH